MGGLKLCVSSLASGFCSLQWPNLPPFSLSVFLLCAAAPGHNSFPPSQVLHMSLHLLLLSDLADINHISGEGQPEQS